jgi:GNAT superfamily N-acetyltransferase
VTYKTSHARIMCQETAPKSESTTTTGSVVEDDGIIIRRFESSDEEQVKHLFRIGMESLIPATYAAIVKYHALPLTSLPAVVAGAAINRSMRGKQSSLWVAAAAVLPAAGLYYYVKYKYGTYIQASLQDDLSKIEQVYSGKSCFLVAVDTRSENGTICIVGMVAGHARDCDDGVIELRRMSVSSKRRDLGLGTRLVQRLEEECKPSSKMMYLICTSTQYAAHRLYAGAGFIRKVSATSSWWFQNSIEFFRYEKEY